MKRKCRSCGDMYRTEDAYIKIKLNHKDIEAIEDLFFCQVSENDRKKISSKLNKVWIQICDEEEKWKKK